MEPEGLHWDPSFHSYKLCDLEQGLRPLSLSLQDYRRATIVPPCQEAFEDMKQALSTQVWEQLVVFSYCYHCCCSAWSPGEDIWPHSHHSGEEDSVKKQVFYRNTAGVCDLDKQPSESGNTWGRKASLVSIYKGTEAGRREVSGRWHMCMEGAGKCTAGTEWLERRGPVLTLVSNSGWQQLIQKSK